MKIRLNTILAAAAIAVSTFANDEGFVPLFDGKTLTGWTAARASGPDDSGAFSVNEAEQAIHTYAGREAGSKQQNDCLVSDGEYGRYIFKLEYKWVGNRYAPRTDWDRDAGLLFHVHGDLQKVWPLSIEMQIGESPGDDTKKRRFHSGDLFVLGKNLRATVCKTGKYYDPEGEPVEGRSVPTRLGTEKPRGEWNEMEIQVYGAEKAVFILNGETVLEITDIKQQTDDGSFIPLEKGHIGLQAEWAEIMYRNIRIKELPAD
ncbi:DUF1080 domain-containing protein [Pontiella sp.]|uniref:3-keto-disaccharide hydrolase n=1 Tax=Pontiella sp. TaxID=2837462 RepID=UPI00356A5CD3